MKNVIFEKSRNEIEFFDNFTNQITFFKDFIVKNSVIYYKLKLCLVHIIICYDKNNICFSLHLNYLF